MPFPWGPRRGSTPVRVRPPLFAVGQRVSVTCPGGHPARVAFTDDADGRVLGSLADGTEVEILAWRPNGFRSARYRVRATSNCLEGWLAVASLRGPEFVVPPAWIGSGPPTTASTSLRAEKPVDTGRRFGQR
jgi:hypothetical protein